MSVINSVRHCLCWIFVLFLARSLQVRRLKLKKLNGIALHDESSQSYEASLAVYLPPDISELAPPNSSQTGCRYSIYTYPRGMEG